MVIGRLAFQVYECELLLRYFHVAGNEAIVLSVVKFIEKLKITMVSRFNGSIHLVHGYIPSPNLQNYYNL